MPNVTAPGQAETAGQQQPKAAPRTITVRFTKKKETPGCKVFTEQEVEGQFPVIGTLYVKNWFAGAATAVTVTIAKE